MSDSAHKPHLRVALTTNDLTQVDADFASAKQMVIYEVTADDHQFVDVVVFKGGGAKQGGGGPRKGGTGCSMGEPDGEQDAASQTLMDLKMAALAGCSVLFTRKLSDPAAVQVKNADIFPVKMEAPRDITDVIERLQGMMTANTPLWLKRVMRGCGDPRRLLAEQHA